MSISYFSNVWGASKSEFIVNNITSSSIIIVVPSKKEAELVCNELNLFNSGTFDILYFPEYDHDPFEELSVSKDVVSSRFTSLYTILTSSKPFIVVTTPYSLLKKITPSELFLNSTKLVKVGDITPPNELVTVLDRLGYTQSDSVSEQGEFCVRGGVVDIFPIGAQDPVRIEYFDDEIEAISSYSYLDPQKMFSVQEVLIIPSSEIILSSNDLSYLSLPDEIQEKFSNFGRFPGYQWYLSLIYGDSEGLINYLPEKSDIILFDDDIEALFNRTYISIEDMAKESNHPSPMDEFYKPSKILQYIYSNDIYILSDSISVDNELITPLKYRSIKSKFAFEKNNIYQSLNSALKVISEYIRNKYKVIISMESDRLISFLGDFCKDHEIILSNIKHIKDIKSPGLFLYKERISGGYVDDKSKIALITDEEIFGFIRKKTVKKQRETFNTTIADLESGDFVVHVDYGIGIYSGLKNMEMGGIKGDYLVINYDNNEILYVPLQDINHLHKYIGVGNSTPKLSSLQSSAWGKLKSDTSKRARKIAQDLLKLYAERKARIGFSFKDDGEMLSEFERRFEYDETEDQLTAIMDVYRDMESSTPMDRLICGDVGFGKTEVAMRAAYKAVISGKQVAFLSPTTVLTIQHTKTLISRFHNLPVNIQDISRIKTSKEIRSIKERLANGEIDILVGTHRILSKDIVFKDLGLLIVDEEQRFGVSDKEKISAMRTNIDVLALSATPIPRTLQLSLSGIREISVIQTPPSNRKPVSVKILSNIDDIKYAMERELSRNGQIFFLHNRVSDLDSIAYSVKKLLPFANVASAHGHTPSKELENILDLFSKGDIDVLVATSIIENGIDIPNANAIFIDKANTFGLSQLYQLKGRVGRGGDKAYCYLIIDDMHSLTPIAKKRISLIQQLSDLGSGLKIAMYDLQIRGAGDILGAAQSGFITKVGYELFLKMISEAVAELKENSGVEVEAEIITQFPHYIAADYIDDPRVRLDYYHKFSKVDTIESLNGLFSHIIKEYGELRPEILNLGYVMLIKNIASQTRIIQVGVYPNSMRITFSPDINLPFEEFNKFLLSCDVKYRFIGSYELSLIVNASSSILSDYVTLLDKLYTFVTNLPAQSTHIVNK